MINKGKRKIGSKTARAILTWSHYTFKQRLLNKAMEFPWVKVFIVAEEFTSKTCGACGKLNDKLGSKKDFNCSFCARNILLKFLSPKSSSKGLRGILPPHDYCNVNNVHIVRIVVIKSRSKHVLDIL